jgi:hypothetical protein
MGYRQRPAGRDRSSLATPWGNTIIGLIWWTSAAAAAPHGGIITLSNILNSPTTTAY